MVENARACELLLFQGAVSMFQLFQFVSQDFIAPYNPKDKVSVPWGGQAILPNDLVRNVVRSLVTKQNSLTRILESVVVATC